MGDAILRSKRYCLTCKRITRFTLHGTDLHSKCDSCGGWQARHPLNKNKGPRKEYVPTAKKKKVRLFEQHICPCGRKFTSWDTYTIHTIGCLNSTGEPPKKPLQFKLTSKEQQCDVNGCVEPSTVLMPSVEMPRQLCQRHATRYINEKRHSKV